MLLSAVSVLVVAQSSSEIPEGLMNNPVQLGITRNVAIKSAHTDGCDARSNPVSHESTYTDTFLDESTDI